MQITYPLPSVGKPTRWVHQRDFQRNPMAEFGIHSGGLMSAVAPLTLWTVTNITTGVWVSAPVWSAGKSGVSLTSDSTDSSGFELQSNHLMRLVNIGDRIIMRREIMFGVVADCGVAIGIAETDTSVFNDTIGSLPNNCVMVHKTIAGTEFTLCIRSASGTAYTQALTLPAAVTTGVRYYIEIEIVKGSDSATAGKVIVRIGTDMYPDSDPVSQGTGRQWVIENQAIPASTADLRETISTRISTTNSTVFNSFGGGCAFYSNRGMNAS